MTEAMKTMDSGMAAAEMELRSASRSLPPAAPPVAAPLQPPSTVSGSRTDHTATPAMQHETHHAVEQTKGAAGMPLRPDALQKGLQQDLLTMSASTGADQSVLAAPTLQGSSPLNNQSDGSVNKSEQVSAARAEAGVQPSSMSSLPAAAICPVPSSPGLEASTAQQSEQPAEPPNTSGMRVKSDAVQGVKVHGLATGSQLQVYANSSAAQALPAQARPAGDSSSNRYSAMATTSMQSIP